MYNKLIQYIWEVAFFNKVWQFGYLKLLSLCLQSLFCRLMCKNYFVFVLCDWNYLLTWHSSLLQVAVSPHLPLFPHFQPFSLSLSLLLRIISVYSFSFTILVILHPPAAVSFWDTQNKVKQRSKVSFHVHVGEFFGGFEGDDYVWYFMCWRDGGE